MSFLAKAKSAARKNAESLDVVHFSGTVFGPYGDTPCKARIAHGGAAFFNNWRQLEREAADAFEPKLTTKQRAEWATRFDTAAIGRDVDLSQEVIDARRRVLKRTNILREFGWAGPRFETMEEVKAWCAGKPKSKVLLDGEEVKAEKSVEEQFEKRAEVSRETCVNEDQPDEPRQMVTVERDICLNDLKPGWKVVREYYGFRDEYFMPGQSESSPETMNQLLDDGDPNLVEIATQLFVRRWMWDMNTKEERKEDRKNSVSGASSSRAGRASRKASKSS